LHELEPSKATATTTPTFPQLLRLFGTGHKRRRYTFQGRPRLSRTQKEVPRSKFHQIFLPIQT